MDSLREVSRLNGSLSTSVRRQCGKNVLQAEDIQGGKSLLEVS